MEYPKRKNMRLKGFEYSTEGCYFITVCTSGRRCILSHVVKSDLNQRPYVKLSRLGIIADEALHEVAEQSGICVCAYVIMPNHIHLLISLKSDSKMTVGRFIGAFKSITANRWRNQGGENSAVKLWQRNYYDHIIRNEKDYLEKLQYIDGNADKWNDDELNEG